VGPLTPTLAGAGRDERPRCQDVGVRDLPTRGLVRGARLAAVPASFVGRRAVGLGRRVGGQPAELIAAEVQARTAEQLFAVLGELKGGAMKVAQWMSAMEAALPDELAAPYGEALTRLQEAAPPMSTSLVHQVLAEELGRDWRDLFARFDDAPAAAASIGQVHRATWHDGRAVAVKVQYPRAGDALATDLRQLGRLVPLIRVAAPGLDARGLFTELRSQLMAEVDYRQEAGAQTSFADAFRGDADFLVPPVVEVTDRVLVSEWVAGAPVAVIARRGESRKRRRTALLLTRFLLSSPSRVGRLHGDPHPGNFRLTDDGRLAVLDFGCSLPMPRGWPPRLEELLRAGRDLDSTALFETATATGLVGQPWRHTRGPPRPARPVARTAPARRVHVRPCLDARPDPPGLEPARAGLPDPAPAADARPAPPGATRRGRHHGRAVLARGPRPRRSRGGRLDARAASSAIRAGQPSAKYRTPT
jgi:predicted unusual protein kinase regulating ubiquinone biosynthesis (AarF/ABC1/UbiB family)